ncbi:hypothetical protein QBC42DRAFT_224453 [Cladorrhinum samala]|uniref:Rhodopsin domain-containing protein n=1 Tax=Cladorrhinum samala TaxID=585594 RepID=A0AAV9HTD6_9PEZI|nr:hypothetical protein QBC42DRAFT_224453 [Cladorrhinum samala]
MANIGMTEPGHTKFNLSYPLVSSDYNSSSSSSSSSPSSPQPPIDINSLLLGLLLPHCLATLFILLRLGSRLFLLRKWYPDDSLILLAFAFSTAVCALYSIAPPPSALHAYLSLIFHQSSLLLTKLSILAFYLRVFSSSRPAEFRLSIGTIVFVLLYGLPLTAVAVFQCGNSQLAGRCFTFKELLISGTTLHSLTDAWLVVLIVPCVVRLKELPARQKAAVGIVLSLSIFVVAASLTRALVSLGEEYGERGDSPAFFVMTVLELDVGLICASAPMLRLIVGWIWPRFIGEPRGQGGRDRGRGRGRRMHSETAAAMMMATEHSGARSKNPSVTNMYFGGATTAPPIPPPALLMTSSSRTPTTLSLRSFMSSMAPRSRGHTTTASGDRAGLLLLLPSSALGGGEDGVDESSSISRRRRSSVGFEGYYDQYVGYNNNNSPGGHGERRKSWASVVMRAAEARRCSRGSRCYSGRWQDSQESFVLGVNDPNSPSRLTPVSDSVFGDRLTLTSTQTERSPSGEDSSSSSSSSSRRRQGHSS